MPRPNTHDTIMRSIAMFLFLFAPVQARIHRSTWAKTEFKRTHPCPSTHRREGPCPGWVIDHIKPLACGGADAPENMQWQTVADGKAKDRWELKGPGCPVKYRR